MLRVDGRKSESGNREVEQRIPTVTPGQEV